jgi:hypothetical protein
MLKLKLIRSITSPFSSPILLVKNNGTWHFYTNYRALNLTTIKYRFPIATTGDMLNELHGASYFTKLDLRDGYHQVWVHSIDFKKQFFALIIVITNI